MTNFLLGILKNGQIMNPDEVAASEADTPANYATARLAVAAGRAGNAVPKMLPVSA